MSNRIKIWFVCVVVIAILPIVFKILLSLAEGKGVCWPEIESSSDVTLIGIVVLADGFGRLCSRLGDDVPSKEVRDKLISNFLRTLAMLIVGLGFFIIQLVVDEKGKFRESACGATPWLRATFPTLYLLCAFPTALGAIVIEDAGPDVV